MGKDIADTTHAWVWSLNKGDVVWVAVEEPIARADRWNVEFLEQTGPSEWQEVQEIFMPYEMKVEEVWRLNDGEQDTTIISLSYTTPKKWNRLRFCFQTKTRSLYNIFQRLVLSNDSSPSTRVFRTRKECEDFCRDDIEMHYTEDLCDALLSALDDMATRVKSVKRVCQDADKRDTERDYSQDVALFLD